MAEQARGLFRHVAELHELDVGALQGHLVVAADGLKPSHLLTELIVVEDERRRRRVLLRLVLGEAESRACNECDAEQNPGRAATQDAQNLLDA